VGDAFGNGAIFSILEIEADKSPRWWSDT